MKYGIGWALPVRRIGSVPSVSLRVRIPSRPGVDLPSPPIPNRACGSPAHDFPPGSRSSAFRRATSVGGRPERRSQSVDLPRGASGWIVLGHNPRVVTGRFAHLTRGPSLEPGYVVPVVITTTASSDFRSTLRRFPGPLVIDVVAAGHRRLATCGLVLAGVETDLSGSGDDLLAIPSPLRREVPGHPLQVPWCRPLSSPFGERLDSSSSAAWTDRRNDAAGFT